MRLKQGESKRKDEVYQYRYTDRYGQRKVLYSRDLSQLRAKESALEETIQNGLDYNLGGTTVWELSQRFITNKKNIRYETMRSYERVLKQLKGTWLSKMKVSDVRRSDAKKYLLDYSNKGVTYKTVETAKTVMKNVFKVGVDDYIIQSNPFDFTLTECIPNNTKEKLPLSGVQETSLLLFLEGDERYCKDYDWIYILLNTGLRISELAGLTCVDIDFGKQVIHVTKQLEIRANGVRYVASPKSKHGIRDIPMSDEVAECFKRIIQRCPENHTVIDGVEGFIFVNKCGNPRTACDFQALLRRIEKKYNKEHIDQIHVSPHILRHTFCTKMANKGMNIKSLQYIMGHANVNVTLSVYAHSSYEQAALELHQLLHH